MSVIWHDVECGGYEADLALWEELAAAGGGSILELGCGTGRVALHLARRGHRVTGLDNDPELLAALSERGKGLALETVTADARSFETGAHALVLAPMQLLQLLESPGDRHECLSCIRRSLRPGGRAAFAIVESMPAPEAGDPLLPDVKEIDGWVYSSLPLDADAGGGAIAIRRLRQIVSPGGSLSDEQVETRLVELSAETVETEATGAGLRPVERHLIPATDAHVGSTVAIVERES